MTDAVILAVASALAGKAAETAVAGGRSACEALTRLVRERFRRDEAARVALKTAQHRPTDDQAIVGLAEELERCMRTDPIFARNVRDLWSQVRHELRVTDGGIVNSVTGTVGGHLIQARDIDVRGDLRLGEARSPNHHLSDPQ